MIYLLVLVGLLTNAVVGQFDTEDACKAAASQYAEMLKLEATKPPEQQKHKGHVGVLMCWGVSGEELIPAPEAENKA